MELITKKNLVKYVVERYQAHYPKNYRFLDGTYSDDKLKLLKEAVNLTEAKVLEIIGNDCWTSNECDECGKDVEATVQLGEEPDYESATAQICLDCLNKAISLIKKEF